MTIYTTLAFTAVFKIVQSQGSSRHNPSTTLQRAAVLRVRDARLRLPKRQAVIFLLRCQVDEMPPRLLKCLAHICGIQEHCFLLRTNLFCYIFKRIARAQHHGKPHNLDAISLEYHKLTHTPRTQPSIAL